MSQGGRVRHVLQPFNASPGGGISAQQRKRAQSASISLGPDDSKTFEEVMRQLQSGSLAPHLKLEALNDLCTILRGDERVNVDTNQLFDRLEGMMVERLQELRAGALRVYRAYIMDAATALHVLQRRYVQYFVIRSLEKPFEMEVERLQALKLVRTVLEVAPDHVGLALVTSLQAIAADIDDKLAPVCLESICELALQVPQLVAYTNGFGTIAKAIMATKDPAACESLALTLLYVMNSPATRKYMRGNIEIETLLVPFTDNYFHSSLQEPGGKLITRADLLAASQSAIVIIMRSWTGFFVLGGSPKGLKPLIGTLLLPLDDTRKAVMDLLFELLCIDQLTWSDDLLDSLGIQADSQWSDVATALWEEMARRRQDQPSLLASYFAAVLAALTDTDLIPGLVELIVGEDKGLCVQATVLLGELLYMVHKYLPLSYSVRLQSCAPLVCLAASFGEGSGERTRASAALSNINKVLSTKFHTRPHHNLPFNIAERHTLKHGGGGNALASRMECIEQLKNQNYREADEAYYAQLMRECGVMLGKDWTRWNWFLILDLLKGPLVQPVRLNDKDGQKLIKRLLQYYLPSNRQFASLPAAQCGDVYTLVGCEMVELMLRSGPDGVKMLAGHELVRELAEAMHEITPGREGEPLLHGLFTEDSMRDTIARDYFLFIGILSSCEEGVHVLERFSCFTALYQTFLATGRTDIHRQILYCLDYNFNGQARALLYKVLLHPDKFVRISGTSHLRVLYRLGVQDFATWGVEALCGQLYDTESDVVSVALGVLDELCEDSRCLEATVERCPALLHLGNEGRALLLRFLGTPLGFKYAATTGYLEREMVAWQQEACKEYVSNVETALAERLTRFKPQPQQTGRRKPGFVPGGRPQQNSNMIHSNMVVRLPVHLYGELCKTMYGKVMMEETNVIACLADTVQTAKDGHITMDNLLDIKAAIWALGHIGSSGIGLELLSEKYPQAVADMVHMAETCSVLSLRGTCLYGLGLIGRTEQGAQVLLEFCWDVVRTPTTGAVVGVALPSNIQQILHVDPVPYEGSYPKNKPDREALGQDRAEDQLLKYAGQINNAVLANAARMQLKRLKDREGQLFNRMDLYLKTVDLVTEYQHSLTSRRQLQSLFDLSKCLDTADRRSNRHTMTDMLRHSSMPLQDQDKQGDTTDTETGGEDTGEAVEEIHIVEGDIDEEGGNEDEVDEEALVEEMAKAERGEIPPPARQYRPHSVGEVAEGDERHVRINEETESKEPEGVVVQWPPQDATNEAPKEIKGDLDELGLPRTRHSLVPEPLPAHMIYDDDDHHHVI